MEHKNYRHERWNQIFLKSKEIDRFMNSRTGRVADNRLEWEYGYQYEFEVLKPSYVKTVPGRMPLYSRLLLIGGNWRVHCLILNWTVFYCHAGYGWIMTYKSDSWRNKPRMLNIPETEYIHLLESVDLTVIEHSQMYLETLIKLRDLMPS